MARRTIEHLHKSVPSKLRRHLKQRAKAEGRFIPSYEAWQEGMELYFSKYGIPGPVRDIQEG